jgi:site-specific DNA-methyltransferase (adenine-specific)
VKAGAFVKEEIIGDCRLYLGDCREVLPLIGAVDTVIADPPFSIPHEFGEAKGRPGKGTRALQWDWDADMSREDVVAALRLAVERSQSFMTFCGLSQATLIADMAEALGFIAKPAVWVKECPPPAGKGNWWPSGMQMAVYGYRSGSGAYFGDDDPRRCNVFTADAYRFGQPGKTGHPTQTPLALMDRFARALVPPSGVALDPFMGSGTTGVACAKLRRGFIGIEANEKWFDVSCKRIEATYAQPDLFVQEPVAPKPKQIDMLAAE